VPHYSKTRNVESNANLTDITPPDKRALYEAALRDRQRRLDELTASMTKIEDEAIKKMPTEDQRASEGPDRPQVIKKVPGFLEGEQLAEYRRLRRELDDLKKRPTPNQDLALSVNNCVARPPAAHVMIRGNPHSPGAEVGPGFPQVLGRSRPEHSGRQPGRQDERPAHRARRLDRQPEQSVDRPRAGEPPLAAPFRPRDRAKCQ